MSSRVLFHKSLRTLLADTGVIAAVAVFDSILTAAGVNDLSQPRSLLIHATGFRLRIDPVHQLREMFPGARALLPADDPSKEHDIQALEAGACGCPSTAEQPQVMAGKIHRVAQRERWFTPRVTSKVIERFVAAPKADEWAEPLRATVAQNSTSEGILYPLNVRAVPCGFRSEGMRAIHSNGPVTVAIPQG